MRLALLSAASLAAAALLAGCGGSGSSTTTTKQPFDAKANGAYEKAYEDCGSVAISDLASRYHVKPNRDKVALGVAKYWAGRYGGGSNVEEAAKEGCYDGYKAAGH
jgi:hypothetical protein